MPILDSEFSLWRTRTRNDAYFHLIHFLPTSRTAFKSRCSDRIDWKTVQQNCAEYVNTKIGEKKMYTHFDWQGTIVITSSCVAWIYIGQSIIDGGWLWVTDYGYIHVDFIFFFFFLQKEKRRKNISTYYMHSVSSAALHAKFNMKFLWASTTKFYSDNQINIKPYRIIQKQSSLLQYFSVLPAASPNVLKWPFGMRTDGFKDIRRGWRESI